jgi:hypothetical protein
MDSTLVDPTDATFGPLPACPRRLGHESHLAAWLEANARLIVAALVVLGAAIRMVPLGQNGNLWIDEAMLALNVVHRTPQELLQPLDWNQGAPVGFLLLSQAAVASFGGHEWALRLVPLVGAIGGLVGFAWFAPRCLPAPAAVLAMALYSVSPNLVSYAAEFKQYSTDAAITVGVFGVAVGLLQGHRGPRRWIALAVAGSLAIWVSHPAVFVLGGIGLALGAQAVQQRDGRQLLAWGGTAAGWLASLALCYWLTLKHLGSNRYLQDYWMGQFLPLPRSAGDVAWLVEHCFDLFSNPGGFVGQPLGTTALAALLFLVGIVALSKECWPLATALVTPGLLALVASALHKYPFAGRFLLFLVPVLLLGIARGAWAVRRAFQSRQPLAAGLVITVLLAAPAYETARRLQRPVHAEQLAEALGYLRQELQPQDVVYVYSGAIPALLFYTREEPLPVPVQWGGDHRGNRREYRNELQKLVGHPRVWLLFSHRRADEEAVITAYAEGLGRCEQQQHWPGAAVYRFDFRSSR